MLPLSKAWYASYRYSSIFVESDVRQKSRVFSVRRERLQGGVERISVFVDRVVSEGARVEAVGTDGANLELKYLMHATIAVVAPNFVNDASIF